MTPRIKDSTPNLIQHVELVFGSIQHGFTLPTDLPATPDVQYVERQGGSVQGVTVISTLGLSRFELESSASKRGIRQEVFLMVKDGQYCGNVAAVLHQVVIERLHRNTAVLRGEAIKKDGFLFPNKSFVALYTTLPIYYPNEMWTCQTEQGEVVLCWMLPITGQEWTFLSKNGWSKFEDLLDESHCDLFDLDRGSLL